MTSLSERSLIGKFKKTPQGDGKAKEERSFLVIFRSLNASKIRNRNCTVERGTAKYAVRSRFFCDKLCMIDNDCNKSLPSPFSIITPSGSVFIMPRIIINKAANFTNVRYPGICSPYFSRFLQDSTFYILDD